MSIGVVRVLVVLVLAVAAAQCARAADEAACMDAIAQAERRHVVPRGVLGSIALVESGRPINGRIVPWPWTINMGGAGQIFASKAEAVASVRALLASGQRSIDVGCLQVNLAAHPDAFASLEDAFDPVLNADFAARFVLLLTQQTGHIGRAMVAYHSSTTEVAAEYARRLLSAAPEVARFGVMAEPDLPIPPDPPSAYTPRLAQAVSDNSTALQRWRPRLAIGSDRGANWPGKER